MMSQPFDLQTYLSQSTALIASRPPKLQPDNLSPTNTRLMTLALSDHLPPFPSSSSSPSPVSSSSKADDDTITTTKTLPQGHHLLYFPIQQPNSQLSPDGTDPDHAPGAPFVRRMWAGASISYSPEYRDAFVLDGRRVLCVETVGRPVMKGGKVFVECRRQYGVASAGAEQDEVGKKLVKGEGVVMDEVRRLVFMREREEGEAQSDAPRRVVRGPGNPEYSFTMKPDAALLFQFSALTYNAHAIHLDAEYAKAVEGYPERLVHGPLTSVLMMEGLRRFVRRKEGKDANVKTFEYRNLAPLFVGRELKVCIKTLGSDAGETRYQLWIEGADGGLAVKGTATTFGGDKPVAKL
ncbi:hypothetical protein OQA88_174 [Cercophora sp. LCS_1]